MSCRLLRVCVCGLMVLSISAMGVAGAAPSSADYTMEYVSTASGGGLVSSSDYDLVNQINTNGSGSAVMQSADYSVENVIGNSADTPAASVTDWSLY